MIPSTSLRIAGSVSQASGRERPISTLALGDFLAVVYERATGSEPPNTLLLSRTIHRSEKSPPGADRKWGSLKVGDSRVRNAEIASFEGVWPGGYQEGYPQDPLSQSSYSGIDQFNGYANQHEIAAEKGIKARQIGYLSTLYVTYLMCIRNQTRGKTVLEIGPGRGAWSRCILDDGAKHLYALDAVSAQDNNFFSYVGDSVEVQGRVTYDQVQDFSCACVPDGSIDFFFSFGCFCHLSRDATATYFDAIARKMASSARGYIMISDYAKLAATLAIDESAKDYDRPRPGRWYNLGLSWFQNILETRGFKVIDPDIGCNLRDPVVHFAKR